MVVVTGLGVAPKPGDGAGLVLEPAGELTVVSGLSGLPILVAVASMASVGSGCVFSSAVLPTAIAESALDEEDASVGRL